MASTRVIRITLFKIPKKEDQETMVKFYDEMSQTAVKDGKPYILSLECGPTVDNPRSEGYNFVGKSVFHNMEDLMYYDKECEAHRLLKAKAAKELDVKGAMTVFYTPTISVSL